MNDLRPKLITLYVMAMILFSSCEDTEISQEPDPLSNFNFAFLQASEKFYFSINASRSFNNSKLDSVVAVWMGTDSSSVPDTIKLFDDGSLGDIIPNDNIFSRRIANSSSVLSNVVINPIPSRDNLYASIVAVYGNSVKSIPKRSFTIGNIRPEIVSIAMPSTITRPASNPDPNKSNTIKFLLTAKVTDGNGADDVKRVFFKSYDATREVWRTDLKGDQILFNLYDDGTGDSGSGDLQSGDNTYSLNVFIIDTTAVGTYHWYFQAQDFSNAYSEELKKVIEIK